MRKLLCFCCLLLLIAGCASTDRMVRMSGGVLDEYSAPKSSRLRSQKYQKVSRQLSSPNHANQAKVSGMDDTLINIWPFFFRSNEYWSALWPLIDKDPYGFAFRPFYNQEGDDYSVLFPLSAWNPESGGGWVTLFAWTPNGFGFVPLTWQWKNGKKGGAYYTPLFFYTYDDNPLCYDVRPNGNVLSRWSRDELDLFLFPFYYGREQSVSRDDWRWLYRTWYHDEKRESESDIAATRNEWNYYFKGKRPFPTSKFEFEKIRQEIYNQLPQITEHGFGIFPLWLGWIKDDGSYYHRLMLLARLEKRHDYFGFSILGDILASYGSYQYDKMNYVTKSSSEFTSWALLSHFYNATRYLHSDEKWKRFTAIKNAHTKLDSFDKQKPAIEEALKAFDPTLKLPETVVDHNTCTIFLNELLAKNDFPTYNTSKGTILPLFWYKTDESNESAKCILPILLTSWGYDSTSSYFSSWPLMTFIERTPTKDSTTVMTPLVYYAKTYHRKRGDFPVFHRKVKNVMEYQCVELRDRYAGCGLFYRGRFGFNVAKEGVDATTVETLRKLLVSLPRRFENQRSRRERIDKDTQQNDRWKTKNEIERLKRLIRCEEIKLANAELAKDQQQLHKEATQALEHAKKLGIQLDIATLANLEKSNAAKDTLMEKCTELRFYEDIGSGFFFHKANYYNGDNHWHFMHILAGGEKEGDRESTHILHLLYRSRKEGNRSEKIFFPFISSVTDGDDSRFSFMWRLFSIGTRNGKTGGHIFFIPFGSEWN